jgi:predicted ATPase
MASQALVWKIHVFCGTLTLLARIRDKGAEPTIDEINVLDTVFSNEKLSKLFTPETYHVIDYDQEWDEGRTNPYFPEYKTKTAKFFNADSNTTTGMYKFGDVESGATMTLNFKTMPYSNNKYHFTEPFLIYDMYAVVSHKGQVFTEQIIKAEDTLKSKGIYVPWH